MSLNSNNEVIALDVMNNSNIDTNVDANDDVNTSTIKTNKPKTRKPRVKKNKNKDDELEGKYTYEELLQKRNENKYNIDELIANDEFAKHKIQLTSTNNFADVKLDNNKIDMNLDDISLTLITAEGLIDNIKFDEKKFIRELELSKRIIKIQSNYGDVLINDEYANLLENEKGSKNDKDSKDGKVKKKRGRKASKKITTERKKQGSERVFHSQIEFFFYNPRINNSIITIKLFVNGRIQIPGVKNENFKDVMEPIEYFVNYINKYKNIKIDNNKKCELMYITSVMENYKTSLKIMNPCLQGMKVNLDFEVLNTLFEAYRTTIPFKYEMSVIIHSFEKPRFIIKFKTPIHGEKKQIFDLYKPNYKKKEKETTLILFASGKININGGNNRNESTEIIQFVYNIIKMHDKYVYYINI